MTDQELERFVILAGSIRSFDISEELEKICCPVLVLGVSDDEVLGGDAGAEIAEKLCKNPDFSMYTYTGFGHAAFDTAPDYRNRMFDFFMKS